MRVPCRLLYRSIKAASGAGEAHVGPLASRHTVPNRPGNRRDRASSRIIGYHGTYPDISGHIRTCHDRRVRKEPVPDRVPYGQSRAKRAGTGSRTLWSVACERSRCRIASRMARRVPYRPSPDRVPDGSSRAVSPVAGSRAVRPVAGSRLGVSLLVSATSMSLPCSRSGEPKARCLPCPGPTAPVADAATGGLRTFILLHGRGVQSWLSRRRG